MNDMHQPRLEVLQAQLAEFRAEQRDTRQEVREIAQKLADQQVSAERGLAAIRAQNEAVERISRRWMAVAGLLIALGAAIIEYMRRP